MKRARAERVTQMRERPLFGCVARAVVFCSALPVLLGMDGGGHRFQRAIEGAQGWTEVALSDDVLEAARPALADVRVVSSTGEELPYAVGGPLATPPIRLPLFDVDLRRDVETTALVDRGASPPLADTVELEVEGTDFIKPAVIEASPDRAAWSEIARGSIFATGSGARMTTLHFAPNDRRYLRFRFDDTNGPPIRPSYAVIGARASDSEERMIALELHSEPDATISAATYSTSLPSANLPLRALRLHATDAAYVRRVQVFERVLFRDEISRRTIGEAEVRRDAAGEERTTIALSEPLGRHLEIDIERTAGVPLHGVTAGVVVAPRFLRFHAPSGSTPELVYGGSAGPPPGYDVAAALALGPLPTFTRAKLGPARDTGASPPLLASVARGAPIDLSAWKTVQTILLPPSAPIAYLDLERARGPIDDIRIVDGEGRQVPYIVEAEPRHLRKSLRFVSQTSGGETRIALDGIAAEKSVEALEVEVSAPEYFARDVQVVERLFDARGASEVRSLGSARWTRTAGQPPPTFRIPIETPRGAHVAIHIADGDNAPLAIANVSADLTRRRLDFVVAPGDELRLLSGSRTMTAPSYDLALVAERVLSSPAEPASLGDARSTFSPPAPTPPWFWIFVFAAALILLVALARTLTQPPAKSA